MRLYECQRQFIGDARGVVDAGEVGMFSSPTGTGKTMSLLSAVRSEIEDREPFQRGAAVFYASRTHTQLSQAVAELKRLGVRCNAVVLGSRKMYCVNSEARRDGDGLDERCRQLVRDDCCSFYNNESAAHGIVDIEELTRRGQEQGFCPYYAARRFSQECDIVFLPYQLLFTRSGRRSADIDVRDAVVVVDEAHNIYEAVVQMNSSEVLFETVGRYVRVLQAYRLQRARDMCVLDALIEILTRIDAFRSHCGDAECMMRVSEFLIRAGIEDFNMLEIEAFVETSGLVDRLEGYGSGLDCGLAGISQFLGLLTMSDDGGRIFHNRRRVRFTPLDPSMYFEDVLECRALLLAGGTMEPVNALQSVFKGRACRCFSYGSVCRDFLALAMTSGPSGRDLVVKYSTRECQDTMKDVSAALLNLSNTVRRGGMVCFLPSKAYLGILRDRLGESANGKRILYEDAADLREYAEEIRRGPCVLVAVMGGRLSEGVNFSDDLCRLLVVVGVPYPNETPELQERARFGGDDYSTTVAMKTVNQTLGRALRHSGDFAAMVLLDKRYAQLSRLVSPWIRDRLAVCSFRDGFARTSVFLRR